MADGEFRQRAGGSQKHGVGDAAGFADQHAQTDAREDEGVVTLADDVLLALEADRVEGRAGGHQGAAIGMLQGFGGGALGFAGGVAQGEDDGTHAVVRHGADGRRGEIARLAGGADEDAGAHGLNELFERSRGRTGETDARPVHLCAARLRVCGLPARRGLPRPGRRNQ